MASFNTFNPNFNNLDFTSDFTKDFLESDQMIRLRDFMIVNQKILMTLLVGSVVFLLQLFTNRSQEVKINKLCEEINEQVEKNDTLATENETLTTENSELEGQLETLQREVEELKKETEMLHGKVNKLQQRNVVLCETLEEFLSLRVKRRKIASPLDEPVDHGHNLRPTTRVNYAGMDSTKEEETSDEEYTEASHHKSSA